MQPKLILSTTFTNSTHLSQISSIPEHVTLIDVRADLVDVEAAQIRMRSPRKLLFSLKSAAEGGKFQGSIQERIERLKEASKNYDLIDLEGERDLLPEILDFIPEEKRLISWAGKAESYEELKNRLNQFEQTPAAYYKLVLRPEISGNELIILKLLQNSENNKLIAYAEGAMGIWTQPLSAFLGSAILPSSMGTCKDQTLMSSKQLIEDYNLPYTYSITKLFGIVGNPVFNSISPKLHNEAYRVLGLPYLYLPFQVESLKEFLTNVVDFPSELPKFAGFTVVSPFKESALDTVGQASNPDVEISNASNIIVRDNTNWTAQSTDALGAFDALEEILPEIALKKIAIIGCGGTGRTIAAGLKRMNARPIMVNRTSAKGKEIADQLDLAFVALNDFDASLFDVIIHATPVGKVLLEAPFDLSKIKPTCTVIDHVYALSAETALVQYCRRHQIKVIEGKKIARLQIKHQFQFLTGIEIPNIENIKRTA